MEEEVSEQNLIPCSTCGRTFLPLPLKKHAPICEKNALKKRKTFDSLKQRVEGTDLAQFHQKSYIKKQELVSKTPEKPQKNNQWEENHKKLVDAIRSAKGSSRVMSPNKQIQLTSNQRCPFCERQFGHKAFDRHVEWCKEHQTRVQKSPANVLLAKERLEARIKYKVPLLNKSKKVTIKEKYSNINRTESVCSVKSSPTPSVLRRNLSVRKPKSVMDLGSQNQTKKVGGKTNSVMALNKEPEEQSKSSKPKRFCPPRDRTNTVHNENLESIIVSPMKICEMPGKKLVTWKDVSEKSPEKADEESIIVVYENSNVFGKKDVARSESFIQKITDILEDDGDSKQHLLGLQDKISISAKSKSSPEFVIEDAQRRPPSLTPISKSLTDYVNIEETSTNSEYGILSDENLSKLSSSETCNKTLCTDFDDEFSNENVSVLSDNLVPSKEKLTSRSEINSESESEEVVTKPSVGDLEESTGDQEKLVSDEEIENVDCVEFYKTEPLEYCSDVNFMENPTRSTFENSIDLIGDEKSSKDKSSDKNSSTEKDEHCRKSSRSSFSVHSENEDVETNRTENTGSLRTVRKSNVISFTDLSEAVKKEDYEEGNCFCKETGGILDDSVDIFQTTSDNESVLSLLLTSSSNGSNGSLASLSETDNAFQELPSESIKLPTINTNQFKSVFTLVSNEEQTVTDEYEIPKKRRKLNSVTNVDTKFPSDLTNKTDKTFFLPRISSGKRSKKELNIESEVSNHVDLKEARILEARRNVKDKKMQVKKDISNVFLNYRSNKYDPFKLAERQFMELLECDTHKTSPTTKKSQTHTPRPHTAVQQPSKLSPKKLTKSAEITKNRASAHEYQEDDFEYLENLLNEQFNNDSTFCFELNKRNKDDFNVTLNHRTYSDDTSSIDSNLINENDNLSIPEHFKFDRYSSNSSEDTDTTLQNDNVEGYSLKHSKTPEPKACVKSSVQKVGKTKISNSSLANGDGIQVHRRTKNPDASSPLTKGKTKESTNKVLGRSEVDLPAKASDLFAVDDQMYAEYKIYEEMYLKGKEQSNTRKQRNKNSVKSYGIKILNDEYADQTNKISDDSAYGSLNRNNPKTELSSLRQHRDSTSSSGSECINSPVVNCQRMSKFCHECGNKYPLMTAKFCPECGVKRLIL